MSAHDINPEVLRLAIGTVERAEWARDEAEEALGWALALLEVVSGTGDYDEARALYERLTQPQAQAVCHE